MPKRRVLRHEVTQPLEQSYRLLPLTQGQNAIVDEKDFDWLSQWNWCAAWSPYTETFYATRKDSHGKMIQMHRFILGCDERVDHKNMDSLDNRRRNLRPATAAQNAGNARISSRNKSGYKGVHWDSTNRRWRAMIGVSRKRIHIGSFTSPVKAALAYDEAAKKYFGEFARTNF